MDRLGLPAKFLSILLLLLVPVTAMKGDAGLQGEEVILYLRWHHQFQFAGYYAAQKKGFYREAGLRVTMFERIPKKDITDLVLNTPASFGVSTSSLLLYRQKGKPLTVLAAIFQHSPVILISRAEKGISHPQDLVGKRVMLPKKEQQSAEILAMLYNEGLDLDAINWYPGEFKPADYLDPANDALVSYVTDQPYFLHQQGVKYNVMKPSTYGIDFYGDCLFTSEGEIEKHPGRVKAFLDASLKGWEYAMAHPEEIIEFIVTDYKSRLSREHLLFEANAMKELILPEFVKVGHMNPGRWKHIADTFARLRMMEPGYSLEGFIYDPNPVKDYSRVRKILLLVLSFTLLVSLGTVILFIFNKRLQKEIAIRKLTEKNLRTANEEALTAARVKSEFLAKMSHEIRTPLNGVIGMAGLLAGTQLTPEQAEYVDSITISGSNLLGIINNILDFTGIESGRMEFEEEVCDLNQMMEEFLKIVRKKVEGKQVHIRLKSEPGIPDVIRCDKQRLKQILLNLAHNAVKFMEAGVVQISTRCIYKQDDICELLFSVKDEGIGIPEEKIAYLFDPFSQLDSSSSRKYGGTGLGLAISKQLVKLMGGEIWVDSKEGGGATFYFTIRVSVVDSRGMEKKGSISRPPGETCAWEGSEPPPRILVAEDNEINQKLILRILQKMGFQVDLASNGLEVLEAVEKQNYRLILMDIQMPEMDGVEATRRIIERFPKEKRPRIIALTAHAIHGDRERYLKKGMDDYVSKPIDIPSFKEKVNQWLLV